MVVGGLIGIATTTKDGLMNKASVPTKIDISSIENTNRSRISMSIGSTLLFSVKTNGNSGCLFYIVCNDGGIKYVYKITGLSTNTYTFYYDANYLYVQTKFGSSNAVLPLHPTTPIIQERITTIPSDATSITVQ